MTLPLITICRISAAAPTGRLSAHKQAASATITDKGARTDRTPQRRRACAFKKAGTILLLPTPQPLASGQSFTSVRLQAPVLRRPRPAPGLLSRSALGDREALR